MGEGDSHLMFHTYKTNSCQRCLLLAACLFVSICVFVMSDISFFFN